MKLSLRQSATTPLVFGRSHAYGTTRNSRWKVDASIADLDVRMTRMFRAIFACTLLNSGFALGGQVRLSSAWDSPPPVAVDSTAATVKWLFDEDALARRPAISPEFEVPATIWHAMEYSRNNTALREEVASAPWFDLRDGSQQPVAVPLPPAVIGGAAVALLAGSRHLFKRRRRVARTFR